MTTRQNHSSGSAFEKAYGYSRAVRVGETVYVSGTVGYDYAAGTCPEDPREQVRQIVRNIKAALAKTGARLADVVQITTYVESAEVFETIGPVLREVFGPVGPTNTALVVSFPVPLAKVEITSIAIIGCGAADEAGADG